MLIPPSNDKNNGGWHTDTFISKYARPNKQFYLSINITTPEENGRHIVDDIKNDVSLWLF